jgi:iron complex transport system substrate-binding protein
MKDEKNNKMIRRVLFIVILMICTFVYYGFAQECIHDLAGRTIVIKKPFQRIISLYPAHTENLFSLGLDKEIIGVSRSDASAVYTEKVRQKTVFSYHDGPEKFIAARPDLVLIRPMIERAYPALVHKLEQAGIVVVSLQPKTVQEMYNYWLCLGKLTGKEIEARKMIEKFRKGLDKIAQCVAKVPVSKRKKVYFEAIHKKMKTFAPSSIAVFVLQSAGGINIASDAITVRKTNIAFYGKERILSHADEIDIYLAQRGKMNRITVHDIINEPGFQLIKAVREGQVYVIDEKIVSRPTMRLLQGIYKIARILYPELFVNREIGEP